MYDTVHPLPMTRADAFCLGCASGISGFSKIHVSFLRKKASIQPFDWYTLYISNLIASDHREHDVYPAN